MRILIAEDEKDLNNIIRQKLEEEDGIYVYEIEFKKDKTEYEYTIKASDGTILEYDIDN